jgi:hypothetical protein
MLKLLFLFSERVHEFPHSLMHKVCFQGEIDRNHHGDIPNKLYSNAHNMATSLGGVQVMSAAGGGGFGTHSKGLETVLRNAHAYTELNISQFGKGERKTRSKCWI